MGGISVAPARYEYAPPIYIPCNDGRPYADGRPPYAGQAYSGSAHPPDLVSRCHLGIPRVPQPLTLTLRLCL